MTETQGGNALLRQVLSEARSEGRRLTEAARDQAETFAEERRDDAAGYLASIAAALLGGGKQLEQQGYGGTARLFERGADSIGELAGQVGESSPSEVLEQAESFARARPALVCGAAALIGFGLARFLKSSAPEPEAKPAASRSPGGKPASRKTTTRKSASSGRKAASGAKARG